MSRGIFITVSRQERHLRASVLVEQTRQWTIMCACSDPHSHGPIPDHAHVSSTVPNMLTVNSSGRAPLASESLS